MNVLMVMALIFLSSLGLTAQDSSQLKSDLTKVEVDLKNHNDFKLRIEDRLRVSREALEIAIEKAKTDETEAHYYFEAASKIAQFGYALSDTLGPIVPPKGDEALNAGTWVSASLAVNEFKKGVVKINSRDKFLLKMTNNDYTKEVGNLGEKLNNYVEVNITPLEKTREDLKSKIVIAENQERLAREDAQLQTAIVRQWKYSRVVPNVYQYYQSFTFSANGSGSWFSSSDSWDSRVGWRSNGNNSESFTWSVSNQKVMGKIQNGDSFSATYINGSLKIGNKTFR